MAKYRVIFPSYDWDDVWYVNQIIQAPNIMGVENVGFRNGVPPETIKNDADAIQKWIDENMKGCSCLILFQGHATSESKWVRYEIEKADKEGMASFIILLDGMEDPLGRISQHGRDPYLVHGLYSSDCKGYDVIQYTWAKEGGHDKIGSWIEDACRRRGL